MKTSQIIFIITLLSFVVVPVYCLYDVMEVNVIPLSKNNWESQITKGRKTQVSLVHFYKPNDSDAKSFAQTWGDVSNDMKGIVRFYAVNCATAPEVCEKEKVKQTPNVRVYPPHPVPSYDIEGSLDPKKIANEATRYVLNNAVEINSTTIDAFLQGSPSVPKVLLFTEKKGVPTLFKALSMSFESKLFFGVVRKEDTDLISRYAIKTFPQILVIKTTEKKPIIYKGEMKYQAIFDFINIYSEQFVVGGGSSMDSEATKSWLTELIPEMHHKSANDICLQQQGVLCVILLTAGDPDKKIISMLKEVLPKFERKMDRGSEFKFMWLDVNKEPSWKKLFDIETVPQVVVLNPGSRKRFMVNEGGMTSEAIKSFLDRINGGDGHFKNVPNNTLPSLTMK